MAALKLDMTIPIADTGTIHFAADIPDIGELDDAQRQALADTCRDYCEYLAHTIAPALPQPPAVVHDPSAAVLNGITGSRRNTS